MEDNINDDRLKVPEADMHDVAHIAVTTTLSAIPFLGLNELYKFIVTPSLEKRRDRWMGAIAEAIKELQCNAVNIQQLSGNEEFVTLLLQATQSAFKTHQEEKHQMLKLALVKSVTSDVDFDVKQLYMTMVDELSPTHLSILKLIEKNSHATVNMDSVAGLYDLIVRDQENIPSELDSHKFLVFVGELAKAGLIVASDGFVPTTRIYTQISLGVGRSNGKDLPRMAATQLGRDFINFISL